MVSDEELLDSLEAARYLKINEQTFRRLAREGEVPAFKVGGKWRFQRSSLTQWKLSRVVSTAMTDLEILVVEDDEVVGLYVQSVLEGEGARVVISGTGAAALEWVRDHQPDLLILDLKLPDMDGAELLSRMVASGHEAPVIIFTDYPDGELMHRAMQYAPLTVLAKPASRAKLVDAVRRATWMG